MNAHACDRFLVLLHAFQNMLLPRVREAAMPAHDGKHEFVKAGDFDQTYRTLRSVLATSEFRAHAEIFVSSFDRIEFFA